MPMAMNETFRRRYIRRNAEIACNMALREAMAKRDARKAAILLKNKAGQLKKFEEDELENFSAMASSDLAGERKLTLPQLQFFITSQCTLNCRDCNAFIPELKKRCKKPWRLSPEELKRNLDALEGAVSRIRHCMFLGGEPLLHPQLAELLDVACQSPIVGKLEITTNGTLLPDEKTVEVLGKYSDKIYFRASDYTVAPIPKDRFHFAELKALCDSIGTEFLRVASPWSAQEGFSKNLDQQQAAGVFKNCRFQWCSQVYDSKVFVCPKACSGHILGKFGNEQTVDLTGPDGLFDRLVAFYSTPCFEGCATCPVADREVEVAIQAK